MRVALGSADGTITEVKKIPTPPSFDEGVAALIYEFTALRGDQDVEQAVIGIAGVLNREKNMLLWSPHLPEWAGKDLKTALEAGLGVPVMLENDAAVAALGEATHGAANGYAIVAYVTIGTGVGGARIVDGSIDRSAFGYEIGHQYISEDLRLEELVSGTAVLKEQGVPAKEIADEGVWSEYERRFARGLYNTLLHWSPDCVVLGGSMMNVPGMRIEKIVEELARINKAIPALPEVRKAKLEYPGIVGALIYRPL